ncbi:MAG: hypothetical protein ACRDM1_00280 [Gaiellaceae bacterium]
MSRLLHHERVERLASDARRPLRLLRLPRQRPAVAARSVLAARRRRQHAGA